MEDYVTFEQAEALKELGFDWYHHHAQMYYATQCYCEGNNPFSFDTIGPGDLISSPKMKEDENDGWIEDEDYCVLAPTMSQAAKWLREVKGITVLVNIATNKETFITKKVFYFKWFNSEFILSGVSKDHYASYEEALSAGIDRALELLKQPDM